MISTHNLLSLPCICRMILMFLGPSASALHVSWHCHFVERRLADHLTERLCVRVRMVRQELVVMNAVTCAVWCYIEFTSKGTLVLSHLSTLLFDQSHSFMCPLHIYVDLACCIFCAGCSQFKRIQRPHWDKEPNLLLQYSVLTLWCACCKPCFTQRSKIQEHFIENTNINASTCASKSDR